LIFQFPSQVLIDEGMIENAARMGELLRTELNRLPKNIVQIVRGKGLLNAIIVDSSKFSTELSYVFTFCFFYLESDAWEICLHLRDHGLLAKPTHGDKIRFAPPLNITKDQMLECCSIISNAIHALM
jgi:ornithine--oxo-acid transaminase